MNWDRMKVRDKEGEKSSAMQTSGHDIIVACVNSQKLCYTHKTAKKKIQASCGCEISLQNPTSIGRATGS